jgi:signal transduction histidine kinase
MTISLRRALMALVLLVILAGLIPAGTLLDHRLVSALEQHVRDELLAAPLILNDRFGNQAGARMMHARDVAGSPGLALAVSSRDSAAAVARAVSVATAFPGEIAVVVGPDGVSWTGPLMPRAVVDSTRTGAMPVVVVEAGDELGTAALAPVTMDGRWVGAAGVWLPSAENEVAQLSALTRSDVLLTAPDRGLGAYTGLAEPAMGLFALLADQPPRDGVQELVFEGERYYVVSAGLPGGARLSFVRAASAELAIVPTLRFVGAGILGLSLLIALAVGVLFAARLARPVGSLAEAASRISHGDFSAPVERSMVTEVDRVAGAFELMRDALAARIEELRAVNVELEDRQERLSMLQAELVQRDRLSAASRLLAQLAHEVRNPVASVRNCLEILRRRVRDDEEASELADLAIDELLRMHELAEQMLDLHRPRSTGGDCDVAAVAEDVAAVVRMGGANGDVQVSVAASGPVRGRIPADSMKQILLNLVQNAHEAIGDSGCIEIRVGSAAGNARVEVLDTGPGIGSENLSEVFDPFFTTKADVRGVGFGPFTASGLARSYGGWIAAADRADRSGAHLTVEIPLAPQAHAGVPS